MLEAGHEVTAVGRSPEKRALLERQGAHAVDVDLINLDAVRRAVRGAEIICNLATAVPPTEIRTALPWSWHVMDRGGSWRTESPGCWGCGRPGCCLAGLRRSAGPLRVCSG